MGQSGGHAAGCRVTAGTQCGVNHRRPRRCYTLPVGYARSLLATAAWRKHLLLCIAGLALAACSGSHASAVKKVAPVLLAQLAVEPADLDNVYVIEQEGYRDENGNAASAPTPQFVRQLAAKAAQPPDWPASHILVSVSDLGEESASDFIDAADDENVGPPNLDDYIEAQVPGSHDVHTELVDNFPTYDDDTVANRLTWQQPVDGAEQTWRAYGVYIRSGGLLALVALRAPGEADGPDPEGLLKETMSVSKREADKLKAGAPALLSPR